jgi:hypothetical protein
MHRLAAEVRVDVIAVYAEAFAGTGLIAVQAARGEEPIVMQKVGRSELGEGCESTPPRSPATMR